ncbi:FliH/SctL family protein [Dyella tabacisoli]|uniref:Flagellar assembly protein FliH n=1 Tax=Dyella tabacisoli TaxID=2282381 RepID=A0A369UJI9_9GAMM|nr:FliH/SctL family protein [Dyella tabacisoli]RDD79750.1 flagellar assembly protein FliH [Dyella tabacisoli]
MSIDTKILTRDQWQGFTRWAPPHIGTHSPTEPKATDTPSPPTVRDLEALEQQARDEGYAAGLAEGRVAAAEALSKQLAHFEALIDAVARPLQAFDEATEQEMARLAMVTARRVIARELSLTPELIVQAVRQAALALPSATRALRVRLHPDDLALLRQLDASETHWHLQADPALARGDCILESERSRLDARVETRLAAIVDAVLGIDVMGTDLIEESAA